jgi:hypothetical protein
MTQPPLVIQLIKSTGAQFFYLLEKTCNKMEQPDSHGCPLIPLINLERNYYV